jgi:hypothetical protein
VVTVVVGAGPPVVVGVVAKPLKAKFWMKFVQSLWEMLVAELAVVV